MKLGAHQLQYFPGLRFFSKMKSSELFIYLDDVQYARREFQNRNRIRSVSGWQYLTVPVLAKGKFSQTINETEIETAADWRNAHLKALAVNYSRAKYFRDYAPALEKIYSRNYARLAEIALETMEFLRSAFGIKTPVKFSSGFGLASASTQRLVDLCKVSGADEYLSGAGGKSYLDESLFDRSGIKLSWQDFKVLPYPQAFKGFEPDMSALDLLLNCGPESVRYL
ncbi:MAG: WbqC family protein [Elusimicrobiales bacterium]|jgi:hypothetical protein